MSNKSLKKIEKQKRKKILFFSNLYPLPWEPMRGQFNYQQTLYMEEYADISYLIPIPIITYIKQVLLKYKKNTHSNQCLFPFFYIPKFGRFLHPAFMLLSMLISIKPIYWFAKHKFVLTSWAYPEGVVAAILKKIFNFKLTIDCLGSDVNVHRLYPKRKIQLAFAFKNATTVTTKSKDLAKKVVEIEPNSHVKTIYNGVNFERFIVAIKPETTQLKLLFIGNLIKTKGVFELIEAALLLKQENVAFQLTLIGNGPEKSALNALITKNNLNDIVKLIGGVPHKELNQKLAQAHALILPSYREGVPNVIMEALASGTPVIATKVGGIPEVINDGKNGILINSHTPKSIAEGVKRFKTKNWSGINIRKSISSFTWQNTSDSFLESFDVLI